MGWLKEIGYNNMLLIWIHPNIFPNNDRENLQFVKLVLDCEHTCSCVTQNRQKDVDLMQKLRKQMEIVEAP